MIELHRYIPDKLPTDVITWREYSDRFKTNLQCASWAVPVGTEPPKLVFGMVSSEVVNEKNRNESRVVIKYVPDLDGDGRPDFPTLKDRGQFTDEILGLAEYIETEKEIVSVYDNLKPKSLTSKIFNSKITQLDEVHALRETLHVKGSWTQRTAYEFDQELLMTIKITREIVEGAVPLSDPNNALPAGRVVRIKPITPFLYEKITEQIVGYANGYMFQSYVGSEPVEHPALLRPHSGATYGGVGTNIFEVTIGSQGRNEVYWLFKHFPAQNIVTDVKHTLTFYDPTSQTPLTLDPAPVEGTLQKFIVRDVVHDGILVKLAYRGVLVNASNITLSLSANSYYAGGVGEVVQWGASTPTLAQYDGLVNSFTLVDERFFPTRFRCFVGKRKYVKYVART